MAGRPPFAPTVEQRKLVQKLASIRCTAEEVLECVPWGLPDSQVLDEKSLRKHFRAELDKGRSLANMRLKQRISEMVDQGNTAMTIFVAKVQLGWKETTVVEAVGKDGAPLPAATIRGPVFYMPVKDVLAPLATNPHEAPYRPAERPLEPIPTQAPAPPSAASPEPAVAAPIAAGNARPSGKFYPPAAALHRR